VLPSPGSVMLNCRVAVTHADRIERPIVRPNLSVKVAPQIRMNGGFQANHRPAKVNLKQLAWLGSRRET